MSGLAPAEPPEALQLRALLGALCDDWAAVLGKLSEAKALSHQDLPEPARAAAVATYLIRAYTGLEGMFQRVADLFDGGAPSGSA